ncbi:hypothetical protein L3X38_027060 [Prunus dulcis]|uniref:Uncharacterized protein n=1 Tax=Prunus dulcis TaxID=3755 RepID=A0AAD4VNP5_PRUDU|nr:hypothetical protein L3X38_027060 [Prunus dulcis]
MVMEEDTHQSAMLGGGSMALKVDPACQRPIAQYDANGLPSSKNFSHSARSRPAGFNPSSLDGLPKCHHCNGNHYSEKCFKEHGYPDWFADYKAHMYGPKAACTMTQGETRLQICVLPIPCQDLKTHEKIGHGKRIGGCIIYSYRLQQFVGASLIKSRVAVSKTSNNFGCGIVA